MTNWQAYHYDLTFPKDLTGLSKEITDREDIVLSTVIVSSVALCRACLTMQNNGRFLAFRNVLEEDLDKVLNDL